MTIEKYTLDFDDSGRWFAEEVKKGYHARRIADVIYNRDYLGKMQVIRARNLLQEKL